MANFIPKIEYGLGPTVILFEFPPEGDSLNTELNASETTNISFNGKTQTSWGYNQITISPHFKLVNQDVKDKMDNFFTGWASKGQMFKYYPHSDGAESYTVSSTDKKFDPKSIAIQSHDTATQKTKFFWEFDLPMMLVDPGQLAVSGAPVTSVNTRIGDVFVREIYNASETDIIATGTDTGLDAKIIVVPDTTVLIPEEGRLAFDTTINKFIGFDGANWVPFGNMSGSLTPGTQNTLAIYDAAGNLSETAYTFPPLDGLASQILQTDGLGAVTFVNIPPTIVTPNPSVINRPALFGDLVGGTLIEGQYTLPVTDGVIDQVLTSDGAGNITWQDAGGAGVYIANDQTVVAAGTINLLPIGLQSINLTAATPVTLAGAAFVIPVGLPDRARILLQGTSDINTVTLNYADIAGGTILFGNATLGNYYKLELEYQETANRIIQVTRNF